MPHGYERHTTDIANVVVSQQHGEWLRELANRPLAWIDDELYDDAEQ